MNPISNEPVMTAVIGLLVAGAAMLIAFGVHLTQAQVDACVEFAQAALVVAFLVRSAVTPHAHKTPPVVLAPVPDPVVPVEPAA